MRDYLLGALLGSAVGFALLGWHTPALLLLCAAVLLVHSMLPDEE